MKIDSSYVVISFGLYLVLQAAWKVSTECGVIVTGLLCVVAGVLWQLWKGIPNPPETGV
jgi:hypothetical protein